MALQMPNNALFGLAIQQGGGGQGLSDYLRMTLGYEHLASNESNFYYYPLTSVGLSPVKTQTPLPPEIGGRALTTGMYPTGTWGAGPVSMIPRLDNRLGWLLLAAMGDVSTVADTKISNLAILGGTHGSDVGIYSHIFQFNSTDQYFTPWCTFRRYLPHTTASGDVGETFQDGKVAGLTLTAAAGAPVTLDLDLLARLKQSNYVFDYDPSWSAATYDDFDNFGTVACTGHFQVESTAFDVTAVTFTLANQLLPPQQSLVIGTTHPKDFPNLGRAMGVTATFLVSDWDFYVSTFVGSSVSAADSNVGCTIYKADLDVEVTSQTYISGTEPYRLRILSNPDENNVTWTVNPLVIVPNRPLTLQANATVLAVEGTGWETHPVFVCLQNAQTSYALPDP